MKIKLTIIFSICFIGLCNAQVGVNIENTQEAFHIKGTTGTNNEVVVQKETGNVGIGTTNPTEKLEVANGDVKVTGDVTVRRNVNVTGESLVKGKTNMGGSAKLEIRGIPTNSLRIEGNTNKENFFLTSDADGVGSWMYLRPDTVLSKGSIVHNRNINGSNFVTISQQPLTLTKGKWLVMAKVTILTPTPPSNNTNTYFLELCLKDAAGNILCEAGVMSTRATGEKLGTPNITYILHVPDNTPVVCSVGARTTESTPVFATYTTSHSPTASTVANPCFFQAIKLDDQ